MPTYLYKCRKCDKEFEYFQNIKDEALKTCPIDICENECKGSGEVYRKISKNIGLSFKGTGFYLTDYKKSNTSAATNSGSNEKAEKSADEKSDNMKSNSSENKMTEKQEKTTSEKTEKLTPAKVEKTSEKKVA